MVSKRERSQRQTYNRKDAKLAKVLRIYRMNRTTRRVDGFVGSKVVR